MVVGTYALHIGPIVTPHTPGGRGMSLSAQCWPIRCVATDAADCVLIGSGEVVAELSGPEAIHLFGYGTADTAFSRVMDLVWTPGQASRSSRHSTEAAGSGLRRVPESYLPPGTGASNNVLSSVVSRAWKGSWGFICRGTLGIR